MSTRRDFLRGAASLLGAAALPLAASDAGVLVFASVEPASSGSGLVPSVCSGAGQPGPGSAPWGSLYVDTATGKIYRRESNRSWVSIQAKGAPDLND